MAASGNIASSDSASTLVNLLNLVKGSKSTTTTKSNISDQGMNAIIQQILGSAGGLSSIAAGEKNAGLYGSTTKQLLVNDLTTRTAGELAKQKAGTTSQTKTPAKVGTTDILGLLALSAGKNILGPTIEGLGKKYGPQLANQLQTSLGLGDNLLSNSANFAPLPEPDAIDLFSGTGLTDALASFGSNLGEDFGADVASSVASDVAESGGGDFLDWIFG